ncbi:MAG: branched-chain amino acid ABC transporter permease [bacterium]
MFLHQIINGVTLGSIYALIALGYTLVYGILLMINFAHSEIFMIGAYIGLALIYFSGVYLQSKPIIFLLLIFLVSMSLIGCLGVLVERIAYRPLRHAPRLAPLLSAIGVSIILQNLIMVGVSAQSLPYPDVFPIKRYTFYGFNISSLQIFIITQSIILLIILHLFIHKTKLGRAMRACSQDMYISNLMGIDVNKVVAITFFVGGGLGAAAGILNGMYYGSIKYNMGFIPGIKAFTAAVLGGIGNIKGAVVGGYLLGIIESIGAGYLPAEYKDMIAFIILILVLIFKPTGIFGEQIVQKT